MNTNEPTTRLKMKIHLKPWIYLYVPRYFSYDPPFCLHRSCWPTRHTQGWESALMLNGCLEGCAEKAWRPRLGRENADPGRTRSGSKCAWPTPTPSASSPFRKPTLCSSHHEMLIHEHPERQQALCRLCCKHCSLGLECSP